MKDLSAHTPCHWRSPLERTDSASHGQRGIAGDSNSTCFLSRITWQPETLPVRTAVPIGNPQFKLSLGASRRKLGFEGLTCRMLFALRLAGFGRGRGWEESPGKRILVIRF